MLTRREFLVVSAATTACMAYDASAQQPASSAKPNILFILADDLGWGDLSCYGRPDYKTPVLDELAARGIRPTQAYANSSTCTPTRVALVTGRYQTRLPRRLVRSAARWRAGRSSAQASNAPQPAPGRRISNGARRQVAPGLPAHVRSVEERLRRVLRPPRRRMTYFTHKSGPPSARPTVHGLYEAEARVEREGYATDLFTDRAIDIVKRTDPKPFFLSLHFNAPHWPWEGPQDQARPRASARWRITRAALRWSFRSMMESLDAAIGRVLTALEQSGRARTP